MLSYGSVKLRHWPLRPSTPDSAPEATVDGVLGELYLLIFTLWPWFLTQEYQRPPLFPKVMEIPFVLLRPT